MELLGQPFARVLVVADHAIKHAVETGKAFVVARAGVVRQAVMNRVYQTATQESSPFHQPDVERNAVGD